MLEMIPLEVLMIIVVALIVMGFASLFSKGPRKGRGEFAYRRVGLLTKAELPVATYLRRTLPHGFYVSVKPRLADVIEVDRGVMSKDDYFTAFRKVSQKHLDMIVIDADGVCYAGIEVDDKSHEREDRIARDRFVNYAMESAEIELIRVKPGQFAKSKQLVSFIESLRKKNERERGGANPRSAMVGAR